MRDPLSIVCPYCSALPDQPCRNMRGPGRQVVYSNQSNPYSTGLPTKRPHPERLRAAKEEGE